MTTQQKTRRAPEWASWPKVADDLFEIPKDSQLMQPLLSKGRCFLYVGPMPCTKYDTAQLVYLPVYNAMAQADSKSAVTLTSISEESKSERSLKAAEDRISRRSVKQVEPQAEPQAEDADDDDDAMSLISHVSDLRSQSSRKSVKQGPAQYDARSLKSDKSVKPAPVQYDASSLKSDKTTPIPQQIPMYPGVPVVPEYRNAGTPHKPVSYVAADRMAQQQETMLVPMPPRRTRSTAYPGDPHYKEIDDDSRVDIQPSKHAHQTEVDIKRNGSMTLVHRSPGVSITITLNK